MLSVKHEVFWYTRLKPQILRLHEDVEADAVVIGGGIAGLAAAQNLLNRGLKVVLLERDFIGSGASGKTSGFITPDSELELTDLVHNYGKDRGKALWEFAKGGVEAIRKNILDHQIECDYQVQDSMFIANSRSAMKKIRLEHETHDGFHYKNTFYTKGTLSSVLGTDRYLGAIRYPDTFGMNSYLYCQGMKRVLQKRGVRIFEKTPALKIGDDNVSTPLGSVKARHVVLCVDRQTPRFHVARGQVYQAQTFLAISKPLDAQRVAKIFPDEKMMAWDSDLIYHYFRITGDNRLLIGGSDLLFTYYPKELTGFERELRKLYRYLKRKFPKVDIELEYLWPGLIGVSKDFAPVIGQSEENPHVYYAAAGAGLPWSVAIGNYICDKIFHGRSEFDFAFSSERPFFIGPCLQRIITKPVSFALSHGYAKYLS